MFLLFLRICLACIIFTYSINGIEDGFLWQDSGLFEGDIALTPQQQKAFLSRNMILLKYQGNYWTDSLVIYYAPEITSSQKAQIQIVLNDITNKTCVKVREMVPGDLQYVNITNYKSGCWSYIGKIRATPTGQQLNLQDPGCFHYHIIYHEFLHALGMAHMQSSPERVGKVIIDLDNVEYDFKHNFDVYDWVSSGPFEYDYNSVMHYNSKAFAKDENKPTMWRNTTNATLLYDLGNNEKPTPTDMDKLRHMYPCPKF